MLRSLFLGFSLYQIDRQEEDKVEVKFLEDSLLLHHFQNFEIKYSGLLYLFLTLRLILTRLLLVDVYT